MNTPNNKQEFVRTVISISVAAAVIGVAYGGVPLNNLQGTGGIAFNPLAYTAGLPWEGGETNALNGIVSKPQAGAWYVNLTDAEINWFALGAAVTDSLTLVGAYAYTGDKDRFYRDGKTDRLGVGGGFVLSVQYQF